MAKSPSEPDSKTAKLRQLRWVISVFLATIVISGTITLLSDEVMDGGSLAMAFFILLVIVAVGIFFDIIGMAVATADEKPFHSMAARKVPGAQEAIRLLRNAERVSSVCNDVVGDICGVVAGAASATAAVQLAQKFSLAWPRAATLGMSALVAGLTVGGKAIGKAYAVRSCTQIVHAVGKFLYRLHRISHPFSKKQRKR
ncbi:MAG: hypothetical protein LUH51_00690 [Firmicutes bacterium]|nr:hypothetical protein [Bacillota bacterium]